jgi:hypothetical protein
VDDVLGIRITCKCGVAFEGSPEHLLTIFSKGTCPGCSNPWATVKEGQSPLDELNPFLQQWKRFNESMASSSKNPNWSLAFCVKEDKPADK